MSTDLKKTIAAGGAAVALAFGAYALGSSGGDSGSATASGTAQAGRTGQMPQGGQIPQDGQVPQSGQLPPGLGTPVTGAVAEKVKAAALARYDGTLERVVQRPDGSYVAHVITGSGERHVRVSKDYKVLGVEQGGPGGPGGPPSQGSSTPPSDAPSQGSATPSSGATAS